MTDLATRIERLYQTVGGGRTPYGARAWFARQARVTPGHLSRVLGGTEPLTGRVALVLDHLETKAKP